MSVLSVWSFLKAKAPRKNKPTDNQIQLEVAASDFGPVHGTRGDRAIMNAAIVTTQTVV